MKESLMFRDLKSIWANVIVYTLLDTVTALVILVFVYIPVHLVYFITRSHLNINFRLVTFSFFVLTLLYMLSILITSWWRHYTFVKSRKIKQSQPDEVGQSDQNTQPPRETE